MAACSSSSSSKLNLLRKAIAIALKPRTSTPKKRLLLISTSADFQQSSNSLQRHFLFSSTNLPFKRFDFCSYSSVSEDPQGPAAIDYRSLLQEDEYHRLANSTIHDLLEKLEEYGDSMDIDGFDVDYGNEVLTLKLGSLGTYVINKQTPNRQIWMSSPVSGPSRFDWDQNTQSWIYRRTKGELMKVLETELKQLCGEPINLS